MNRGSFELSVSIPKDGRSTTIREFGHNGFTYVESREGQKFTLKIKNNSASRVLAVPSLDGLSTLDGEPATPHSRGYIIPAYTSVEIKGWRTSLEDINDFVFEKKESGKTYAEGTGNETTNCGVIAVKVFEEKQKPKPIVQHHHHHHHDYTPVRPGWPYFPRRPYYEQPDIIWCSQSLAGGEPIQSMNLGDSAPNQAAQSGEPMRCLSANMVGSAELTSDQKIGGAYSAKALATPNFSMGTGFGAHQKDRVFEETFERGRELSTLEVFYTDAQALREIGIDVDKKVSVNAMPQAFQAGFCKAPVTL
jgi:hypothetical protein